MIVKEKKSQKNSIIVTIINKKKSHVVLKLVHLHWILVILNHHLADNLLFEFGTQFWIQMLRFKKINVFDCHSCQRWQRSFGICKVKKPQRLQMDDFLTCVSFYSPRFGFVLQVITS